MNTDSAVHLIDSRSLQFTPRVRDPHPTLDGEAHWSGKVIRVKIMVA